MPEAFAIGSILVSTRAAGVILSLIVAIWATGLIASRLGLDRKPAQRMAETSSWLGLAGARLGFAGMNWSAFSEAPWTVLYFWQPGYSLGSGLVVGAAYALFRLVKRPPHERPVFFRALAGGFTGAGALLVGVTLVVTLVSGSGALRRGDVVPDFALRNLDGETVRLSSLSGQVVVLNFWATWCPPCRREMPLLDATQRRYAERGVSIVGVNLAEPPEQVTSYVESINVDFPLWTDGPSGDPGFASTRELFEQFGGVGLPTTYFIGPDGVLRDIRVGELNRAILQQGIDNAMNHQ